MIALTSRDRLVHKASWHEDKALNQQQAAVLAADYQATKDRLVADAVRAKLGIMPAVDVLKDRLEFRHKQGEEVAGAKLIWVVLDGEAIAMMTEPTTEVQGYRYVLSWLFKSLVDVGGN